MSKIRFIDPNIITSETIAELNHRQRDLWIRLLLTVDDQGRCPGNPALLRSLLFPLDDIDKLTVESDLRILADHSMVLEYELGGKKYLQVVNWQKYQRKSEWLGKSDYPAPPGWHDRYRYMGKGRQPQKSENWDDPEDSSRNIGVNDTPLPNDLVAHEGPLPIQNDKDKEKEKDKEKGKKNYYEENNFQGKPILIEDNFLTTTNPPSENDIKVWNMALGDLQKNVRKVDFDTYLTNINLVSVSNSAFIVKAKTSPTADLVRSKYGQTLQQYLQGYSNRPVQLEITC